MHITSRCKSMSIVTCLDQTSLDNSHHSHTLILPSATVNKEIWRHDPSYAIGNLDPVYATTPHATSPNMPQPLNASLVLAGLGANPIVAHPCKQLLPGSCSISTEIREKLDVHLHRQWHLSPLHAREGLSSPPRFPTVPAATP